MTNEEYLREIEQFITQLKQYREESKTLATGMIGENFTQDTMTSFFISSLNCPPCGEQTHLNAMTELMYQKHLNSELILLTGNCSSLLATTVVIK